MDKIQKETYLNLILSPSFSKNYFIAKSITLDFLYGFDNPCTAIIYLNEYISEDNHVASMGLNCVLGVLLAVEEYKRFCPTVIVHRFLLTLIRIVNYKLDDFTVDNYCLCMRKIIEFIGENINFKLLKKFVDLGAIFIYSDVNNEHVKYVFDVYCYELELACRKLLEENVNLLNYKIVALKNAYLDKTQNEENEKREMLDRIYKILDSMNANKLFIVSNVKDKGEYLVNKLRSQNKFLDVQLVEKDETNNISYGYEEKVIFLVDFKENDIKEMLYLCGKVEGAVKKNHFLVCFYNRKEIQDYKILSTLVDCYSDENSFEDRLQKFLNLA